jgi:hypothetical protein
MGSVSDIRVKLLQLIGMKTADGSNIQSFQKITYQTAYSLGQLGSEDLIPLRLAQGMVSGSGYEVIFTNVTSLAVNWNTTLIDGVQTYAAALGNLVPMCVIFTGTKATGLTGGNTFEIDVTYEDDEVTINNVTFNFGGISVSGVIRF